MDEFNRKDNRIMETGSQFKVRIVSVINVLLYIFLFTVSLSPLFSYIFKVTSIHLIFASMILLISISLIISRRQIQFNNTITCILIYTILVSVNLVIGYSSLGLFFQALIYRLLYPIIFMFYFSVLNNRDTYNKLGYNFIKVININTIIICFFGLVEKVNPSFIYKLYGNNLTTHLTLILNNEVNSRLVSLSGNPINLGFYMVIGISSSIILILLNWNVSKGKVLFQSVMIFLFSYIIFYTYSRSAILLAGTVIVTLVMILLKNVKLTNKVIVLCVLIIVFTFSYQKIIEIDSINSRLSTMNITTYFQNTRFNRAYVGFSEGTNILQLLFGHGISQMNSSNAYVFELGYASMMYETGVISLIVVIFTFFKGIILGIRINKNIINTHEKYINAFFISIIVSGIVGLFTQDIYMQLPYSALIWFSTLYLIFKEKSINNIIEE
ncbi:hypothetical protein [Vagococcus carniphilus]|uniref:hypothetical protein n=1 Tax=Vagococcus carniphilus TaxID=218144 RepID=UPI00288FEAE9|nr:hypothetical protein [Vagococcus carniphilus]MDT2865745.1 hypothetical protein [Vagococcus carniphilus]